MVDSNRAKLIFLAAIEQSAAQRAAYLDDAVGGDAELRSRVEELLRAYDQPDNYLNDAAAGVCAAFNLSLAESQPVEHPGTLIGPYKLQEQIGEGGMGVVYMAEQQTPVRRRIALKIIKAGMDTRQVVARFEAERQALAMMEHSNIARVLDAGATESGRPYFVMELVRGIPITEYCDKNNLPLSTRLELFVQVCHAVQHAHQKGIIHRDLKPSNILVTEDDGRAVPKIIDFGVAKATTQQLTEKTLFTAFAQMIGTPMYMSPEQAEMTSVDIDTRADVYSLGVLLYELLVGTTPFDQGRLRTAPFDEIRRIIREEEPPPPSARISTLGDARETTAAHRQLPLQRLSQLVAGDLDWIVMRCLEKDRNRRYQTADELAKDIDRYLADQPVEARPPTQTYRLKKFVRRNKVAVLAGSAVATALVLGLILASVGFVRARREAVRADHEAEIARSQETSAKVQAAKSEQVSQFLKDMLKGVAPSAAMGRDTTMLREVVDQTADRIDKDLKDQPDVQIELGLTLGKVYFDLQLYKKMEEMARRTLQLARAHYGDEHVTVADALWQLGRALVFLRNASEAETVTRQAFAMQRKLRGPDSTQEADSLCNLAWILCNQWEPGGDDQKKIAEAEPLVRAGLEIYRKRLSNDNDEIAWALHTLAVVLWEERGEGKLAESEATIREAIAMRQRIHGDEHPYTASDRKLLGKVLYSQQKFEDAEGCYRKSLEIMEKIDGKGKYTQADGHASLGQVLRKRGKLEEAEVQFREAVAIVTKEVGPDYPDLPDYFTALARVLTEEGKLSEARERALQAIDICERNPSKIWPLHEDNARRTLHEIQAKLEASTSDKK